MQKAQLHVDEESEDNDGQAFVQKVLSLRQETYAAQGDEDQVTLDPSSPWLQRDERGQLPFSGVIGRVSLVEVCFLWF